MANSEQLKKSLYASKLPEMVRLAQSLRKDDNGGMDVTLAEVMETHLDGAPGMSELYADLGIDPGSDTITNIFNLPDPNAHWIIPEIILDSIKLGLRRAPIWPSLIAAEQTIKGLQATMPYWNMSDAKPKVVGIGETIALGTVNWGKKNISVKKYGRGIKIPYEVRQYVAISVVSVFLQDFGVKMGQGLDTMLIDTLINGEQLDGSESAPVVGVTVPGAMAYRDLLRVWVRMVRIGRAPKAVIGGELAAINTLDLPEFKTPVYGSPQAKLNIKTPIPNTTDYYIHSAVPVDQQIVVDSGAAVIKYNAQPLLVESEKIVSNQTEAVYCTFTTGFGIMMRDARVVIDQSVDFNAQGFPAYMDPATEELTVFD